MVSGAIVVGDVIRRLVAWTTAQQLTLAVKRATPPHQYALCTKAVCECIVQAQQGITEFHPEATVTAIDGWSQRLWSHLPIGHFARIDES